MNNFIKNFYIDLIINEKAETRKIERILFKLDVSESFFYGNVETQPGLNRYNGWKNDLLTELNPEHKKEEAKETWKELKRKGKVKI